MKRLKIGNKLIKEEDVISYAKSIVGKEADGAKKLLNFIDNNFIKAIDVILNCKGKVVITGVGKSGHIGKKIAATMASTGTPSFFVHSDEALHGDLGMVEKKDVVIAISNSGETRELINILKPIRKIGCKIVSITSDLNCTIAKNSDVHVCIGKLIESDHLNLAPTTSSTVTLIMGDALALTASYIRGFKRSDFALYHPGGSLGKNLTGIEI